MVLAQSLKHATVREVPVELEADGKKVKVSVRYKSLSVKDVREQRELFRLREASGETVYLSETLANRLLAIVEADGNSICADVELLENMSIDNLQAINKAIEDHTDPK